VAPATGGNGSLLALLLLIYGVSGILGNLIAGRLTDRFGSRRVGGVALAAMAVLLALIPFASSNLVAIAIVFCVWGVAVNAITLPVQHRLVEIDPATSAIALSVVLNGAVLWHRACPAPRRGRFAHRHPRDPSGHRRRGHHGRPAGVPARLGCAPARSTG